MNGPPLADSNGHQTKSMSESECSAFRRSKKVKVSFSHEGSPKNSINLVGGSKIKFIAQFHVGKALVFFDTEKKTIGKTHNVKTSAARQAWKREIDSIGQDSASLLGACEPCATATSSLSRMIFR
jgi:hypothetical protein